MTRALGSLGLPEAKATAMRSSDAQRGCFLVAQRCPDLRHLVLKADLSGRDAEVFARQTTESEASGRTKPDHSKTSTQKQRTVEPMQTAASIRFTTKRAKMAGPAERDYQRGQETWPASEGSLGISQRLDVDNFWWKASQLCRRLGRVDWELRMFLKTENGSSTRESGTSPSDS